MREVNDGRPEVEGHKTAASPAVAERERSTQRAHRVVGFVDRVTQREGRVVVADELDRRRGRNEIIADVAGVDEEERPSRITAIGA